MAMLIRSLKLVTCALVFTALLLASTAQAQSNLGTIQGTVADSTGAAIVDAQITATNTATNTAVESRTNGSGVYSFPFLQPGTYTSFGVITSQANTPRELQAAFKLIF
jgi:hypothetical protein